MKRTSSALGFGFFNFDLEYLKEFKVLCRLKYKNTSNPPTSSADRLYRHKPQSFSAKPVSKNAGESTIVLWLTAHE
jgi:hypothetical protein